MNKVTLSFFLGILSLTPIRGQWEVGFSSGIGMTDIWEKTKYGYISNFYSKGIGYTLNGFMNYTLYKEHLYFRTGIAFCEKGASVPAYNEEIERVGKRRENVYYIESPLQLQFRFFPMFKLQMGIYNAYRLNMKPDEYGIYDDSHVHYDSRYDVGYTAGVIFEYKRYVLEACYSRSIKSIGRFSRWDYDLQQVVTSDEILYYNKTLLFTFGYKIFVKE